MLTRARLAAHPEAASKPAVPLADGQVLTIGGLRLQCFHVPGHCDDHIALFESSFELLMTGDLLFVGKVGGTPGRRGCRARVAQPAAAGARGAGVGHRSGRGTITA